VCGGEVLNAIVAGEVASGAADRLRSAAEPAEDISIVDRVFEQGACADDVLVGAPIATVVAQDREELVVAKGDSHEATKRRIFGKGLEDGEDGRVAKDEADTVLHPSSLNRRHHLFDIVHIGCEGLFAEHVLPRGGSLQDEIR
jgi:hypothetical protein